MDKLAFLDGPEGSDDDAHVDDTVEAPEPASETPRSEQPRDESGKFVKAPEAEPAPAPQPVAEARPEPIMVPLAALQEVRDELKSLKAERAAPQQPPPPVTLPDMFEDPQGYTSAMQERFDTALYQQTLGISHRFAVQQHGAETVEKAIEWGQARCASDPHFNSMVRSNPDPVGFAVQQYQRDQIASQVSTDDFAQFQAWRAAQSQLQAQPAQAAPAAPPSPAPPVSIAAAPSAGGVQHTATGPGVAFDEIFRR